MDLPPRQLTPITAATDDASPSRVQAPPTRSTLARAIVVLAISAAVAYALSRYLRGSESIEADSAEVVPVVDDTSDKGADDAEQAEAIEEAGGGPRETADLDRDTSVDVTEDDRSPEEIVERSREDVPEPGEMAVDDEVAEELLEEADEVVEGDDDAGDIGDDGGADDEDDSSTETDDRSE